MISISLLKERFDRDSIPVKWGGIASDLLRLSSMGHAGKTASKSFDDVLSETKLFTEWLAPQVELKEQKTILSLQRTLVFFSPVYKNLEIAARQWSDKVLELSGLKGE